MNRKNLHRLDEDNKRAETWYVDARFLKRAELLRIR